MNPLFIFTICLFTVVGALFIIGFARKVLLMKTGDQVDAKIVSVEKERRTVNDRIRTYYLLNIVYSYKNHGYAENISMDKGDIERYYPHFEFLNGLVEDGGAVIVEDTIPIVVDPNKPTRIIANFDKLMRTAYPESFGLSAQENDNQPANDAKEPDVNQNPYA